MTQPLGFVDPTKPDHVCLLKKSLYGLKQAPQAWFSCLSDALIQFGFNDSHIDQSLFYYSAGDLRAYFFIYIDDIILKSSSLAFTSKVISFLNNKFSLKELGDLHYFLGIEAYWDKECVLLAQSKYICDLLASTNMSKSKHVTTPVDCTTLKGLTPPNLKPFEGSYYRHVVGSLQYLGVTHPDLAFDLSKVSQNIHKPLQHHWTEVKRILRYLAGTITTGIYLKK